MCSLKVCWDLLDDLLPECLGRRRDGCLCQVGSVEHLEATEEGKKKNVGAKKVLLALKYLALWRDLCDGEGLQELVSGHIMYLHIFI